MTQQLTEKIKTLLRQAFSTSAHSGLTYRQGQSLYLNGQCALLSESGSNYRFSVDDKYGDYLVNISSKDELALECTCKNELVCKHKTAALLQLEEYIRLNAADLKQEGIKYTRKGMIQRVIEERKKKALQAGYTLELADNIFGEHQLINERGVHYHLTFRDLERKHGYCTCPDYSTNKLGTCKHLIFAFTHLQNNPSLVPEKLPAFPFVEVFLNPFRNNKISYFFPEKLSGPIAELFYRYFGNKNFIEDEEVESFTGFLNNTHKFKQILVRSEVREKVKKATEQASIAYLKKTVKLNFQKLKSPLLPFQKEGVDFATFSTGLIVADDLELGKLTQAVATAVMKKEVFGFTKTLVVCPATLKMQWKREIERLTGKPPLFVEGSQPERLKLYREQEQYFFIVNYETVNQDIAALQEWHPDLLILDEAQRLKNYASNISNAIRTIPRRHTLVISGSPFESRLIELYALMMHVDPGLLSPLWEFSYKYCYFDDHKKNNIVGYYNLEELFQRLGSVLLRREKLEVIKQLPQISTIDLPVALHPQQLALNLKFAGKLLNIINKKMLTPFEHQQALSLIGQMRALTGSTFLVDEFTNISPKTEELKSILTEKLNIRKKPRKVIIFTEWKKMLQVIARSLRLNKIRYVEISHDTPDKQRVALIRSFESDSDCNVLIADNSDLYEANIRTADVVVNFDIPADRECKSRRMGSLEKIIQRKGNLTIINMIAKNSLEEKIAAGLEIDLKSPNQKSDEAMPAAFPKLLQAELISALKEIIANTDLRNTEKHALHQTAVSGQMTIDFSTEEAGHPLAGIRDEAQLQSGELPLPINPDKLDQALAGSSALIAQMLKLSADANIEVTSTAQQFDPDTGEIIMRFKIMSLV